jgi:hypothetical protein
MWYRYKWYSGIRITVLTVKGEIPAPFMNNEKELVGC